MSLRELAECQFTALRGIELEKDLSKAGVLGGNLYSIWGRLSYSRLSERDLGAKKLLRDLAIAMEQAGTRPEVAGKAMVILLSKLYNHEGSCAQILHEKL